MNNQGNANQDNVKSTVISGALTIIVVTIFAKIAAFLSTAVLAYYLGTTDQSDALNAIYSVEQVIYPMLGTGIWKVFLPLYKERVVNQEDEKARAFANKTITLFTLLSGVVVLFVFIFSKSIVAILAPGYAAETKELASTLVRVSAPMYFFIINSAVYAAMLQCYNKFFASQIREVVTHIPIIVTAILFYGRFGIKAMAVAIVAGYACRLIIEVPFVDWGYHYRPDFSFKDNQMIQMLKRYPSAMMSEGVNQLNILVDKVMASMLAVGSVSALNYSVKLFSTINGLLSVGVSNAIYPQVVLLKEGGREKELHNIICRVINVFSFIMLPITVGGILFSEEMVTIVYMRGAFNADSVALTSGVFACYCVGLLFVACNPILINIFYAYGDTKTPFRLSTANLVVNVCLNFLLIYFMETRGLALATSLSALALFLLILWHLRRIIVIKPGELLPTFLKALLLSILSCGAARGIVNFLSVSVFIRMILAVIIAAVLYVLLAMLLKMSEFRFIFDNILGKVLFKKKKK